MKRIDTVGHKAFLGFIIEASIIWFLLISTRFYLIDGSNDTDILPFARQLIQPSWLPNDWYLNLNQSNRFLFSIVFGGLISWLGFESSSLVLRFIVLFILSLSINFLYKEIQITFPLRIISIFLFLQTQFLVAGEWFVGGPEAKVIAYALLFISLALFLKGKYLLAFASSGLAISFHVLVGIFSIVSTLIALIVAKRIDRPSLIQGAKWLGAFLIFGSPGVATIVQTIIAFPKHKSSLAWQVYVVYRNPHHLLPSSWKENWETWLVLAIIFFILNFILGRCSEIRFLSTFSLGSICIFLFGLILWRFGQIDLLRFYWFRLADSMIPFMIFTLLAISATTMVKFQKSKSVSIGKKLIGTSSFILSSVFSIAILLFSLNQILIVMDQPQGHQDAMRILTRRQIGDAQPIMHWISENTSREAIFLVDPTLMSFYLVAERSMFVSFKHVPTSPVDILEWYDRIQLINNSENPKKTGFDSLPELQKNFEHLSRDELITLTNEYFLDYYLSRTRPELALDEVQSIDGYTLYSLSDVDP